MAAPVAGVVFMPFSVLLGFVLFALGVHRLLPAIWTWSG